ncbi:lysophospholipid acyltransferase family protein [Loigolactobacillus jiayinensis]|uniref:1-acyl-sn-glycerol-3-phosphate acyltransferase n=1 Tax=Loigolactobacillus jiayinensis TaxID=2486016 RepID=A0ABW1RFN6_9LACO|nr:1-acyl-sn-glycerol-3-phosphate acyltransferase [Loigolactobacillus jiayinensis]
MQQEKARYYHSFTDDFVASQQQNYTLATDYSWEPQGKLFYFTAFIVTFLTKVFSWFYRYCWARPTIVNGQLLHDYPAGCFLYGNHTQPQGDVFIPFSLLRHKPLNFLVSPANLGIPLLGHWLPYGGALPIPNTLHQLGRFQAAVYQRIAAKQCVVVYPEAHVWPYYTQIRPLPLAAFHYPIGTQAASFCMTTTYQKRRWRKRPHITLYLDGPFYPQAGLPAKQQQIQLRDEIAACMQKRSRASNVAYIQYKPYEVAK